MNDPDLFMRKSQVEKLLNAMMQCVMMVHMERRAFDTKSPDEIGEWVRKQLSDLGLPTYPVGSLHAKLYDGLFDVAEIPPEFLDELVGWKALAMDYKFMLDVIANKIDASTEALQSLAAQGLSEESADSRAKIAAAKSKREKARG